MRGCSPNFICAGKAGAFLKEKQVIEDYNQVALLLRSVRTGHSGPYTQALEQHSIPAFAPRALLA